MGSSVLGELLILCLLIINCSRIFFLKYGKVDSLTLLAPVCLVVSVLQILAWNADIFSITLLAISVFATIINFRAMLRFCSGLYVDHYSPAFKIAAILVLLVAIAETVLLLHFLPSKITPSNYGVKKEIFRITGSFNSGFEKTQDLRLSNGVVHKYTGEDQSMRKPEPIIIISDKRADSESYVPYMVLLSQKGYDVYCADFYSKDLKWIHNAADLRYFRRIAMLFEYRKNPVQFRAKKEFFSYNSKKEIEEIVKFVKLQNPDSMPFIVTDWMGEIALDDFVKQNGKNLSGTMKLCEFKEYSTAGFGFINITDPLAAFILGFSDENEKNVKSLEGIVGRTLDLLPYHENTDSAEKDPEDLQVSSQDVQVSLQDGGGSYSSNSEEI